MLMTQRDEGTTATCISRIKTCFDAHERAYIRSDTRSHPATPQRPDRRRTGSWRGVPKKAGATPKVRGASNAVFGLSDADALAG
jgi:hypothetical protein